MLKEFNKDINRTNKKMTLLLDSLALDEISDWAAEDNTTKSKMIRQAIYWWMCIEREKRKNIGK